MMLKLLYRSCWIYWLLIIFFTISVVLAESISDCDADDLECLEDYITTSTSSYVTSSSSSFGEPSSTVTATSTDVLSDFHEAKLVRPKPQNPNIPKRPDTTNPVPDPTVHDNINQDKDLDSSVNNSNDNSDTKLSALSNVEAGILSACGVLVVAGIAVGIFVWKNTTRRRNLRRNHDMPMLDLENNNEGDDLGGAGVNMKEAMGALNGKEIYGASLSQSNDGKLHATLNLPSSAKQVDNDFFTNWQRRNQNDDSSNNFEIEPKQKLHDVEIISEKETTKTTVDLSYELPSLDDSSDQAIVQQTLTKQVDQVVRLKNDAALKMKSLEMLVENRAVESNSMFAEPPSIQANTTATRPSALDPAYDPTALTYPLQKLLHTPTIYMPSPMQISINLGSDEEEDDEEEEQEQVDSKIYQPKKAPHTEPSPQLGESSTDNKGVMGTPLSQHLNKLLRYPSSDRQRMASSSSSKMVEIDLQDDNTSSSNDDMPIHASPRLNHVLGKFAKEPLPVFNEHTEMTQLNLTKAYKQRNSSVGKGPAQLFIDDYKKKYLEEHGKPFMSPLDLPDDQFIPLQDALGPPLISRAEVLADPARRLGEDEIALWEQSCRKKELKRLSYEMWDEQVIREEESDHKHHGIPPATKTISSELNHTVPTTQHTTQQDDDQVLP